MTRIDLTGFVLTQHGGGGGGRGPSGIEGPCGATGTTFGDEWGRRYEYPVQEVPKEEPKPVTCFYCRTQRESVFKCCPRCGGNDIVQPPDPLSKPAQNSGTISCGPR